MYPLSIVFNQLLTLGKFPSLMKIAEIIPLYKGKDEDQVINYRPVLLLMTMSKVLEKLVYKKLYKFLDKHSIFYESQYGFRADHSCENAIMEMVGHIVQAHNDGVHSTGLYLDLLEAFDTLDHTLLLSKMERYGVRGLALDWFTNYLANQSLVAKIPDGPTKVTYSDKFDITYGMGQGSCLGLLLFVIFCNDMQLLDLYGTLILFTDDTTLISSHRNEKYLEYQMHHDFEILLDWFRSNKLSLNMSKTVLMRFWKNTEKKSPAFVIEGCIIPEVTHTKFLSVYVDCHLNWDYHIGQVYYKIKMNQYLLSMMKNLLDTSNLKKLYYAHICSHI